MINKIKRLANKSKIFCYITYVIYCLCGFLISALFMLMWIFPIKKNKIVCCNMKGKRYGDNPKYIVDEIMRQKLDYEIVWLIKPEYKKEVPEGIRAVNYDIFHIVYELATARFWLDSNSKPVGCLKRKNQYYIQTWHGDGFKKVYGDIPDKISIFDKKIIQYNSKIYDMVVSNSEMDTGIYHRAFWYNGEILECGSPRNDIFFEDARPYVDKVKRFFHAQGKKLVLYAPTFRKDFGTDEFHLDFELLKKCLKERFGGEWAVLIRLHPNNIADAENLIEYTEDVLNATQYSVMQELLAACDILISDYSSCILDFIIKKAPCFMYATDVEKYKDERDCYFDVHNLPFPLAENNEEMERNILNFDNDKYENELRAFFDEIKLYADGSSCRQVVEWIVSRT